MSTTAIDAAAAVWQSPTESSSIQYQMPTKELQQADFLKLLVAKMTSQDPLSPMQDTEFLAQMVQMDALKGNRAMLDQLQGMQEEQQFSQANALLGRVVLLKDGEGLATAGVVTAIDIEDGKPRIVVGDKSYDPAQVINVKENKEP